MNSLQILITVNARQIAAASSPEAYARWRAAIVTAGLWPPGWTAGQAVPPVMLFLDDDPDCDDDEEDVRPAPGIRIEVAELPTIKTPIQVEAEIVDLPPDETPLPIH
jgi:hypothetical protein